MKRILVTALAAGNAYLAAMWLDNKLSSHPFNDLKLVGQVFTTDAPAWVITGLANHFGFSVAVTLVYAKWGYKRLPGPTWFRGILFMQLENAILYPGAALLEPRHAGMKSGQVPTLFSWKTFWGQIVRHVAFGLALGSLYKPDV